VSGSFKKWTKTVPLFSHTGIFDSKKYIGAGWVCPQTLQELLLLIQFVCKTDQKVLGFANRTDKTKNHMSLDLSEEEP